MSSLQWVAGCIEGTASEAGAQVLAAWLLKLAHVLLLVALMVLDAASLEHRVCLCLAFMHVYQDAAGGPQPGSLPLSTRCVLHAVLEQQQGWRAAWHCVADCWV